MRIRSILFRSLCGLALASVLAARPVLANNPIRITSTGTAYKWNSFPIIYTVDGGMLGSLTNAEANALTTEAFTAWTSVATASVVVTQNPVVGLGSDGDIDTVAEFNALFPSGPCPNFNAIIYDSGGAITDGLFGAGASNNLLGFASPCLATSGDAILATRAVLIVKNYAVSPVTALNRSKILGVFIHEFGHGLGLGHSQVNIRCYTDPTFYCPSNTLGGNILGVPTMFPFLLPLTESPDLSFQATLSADDVSAISTLYPSPAFATSTGTIVGTVFFSEGINHFQGANVTARRVGDPGVTAVSNVSGMFAQVDHGNPALGRPPSSFGSPDITKRGEYTIPGVPSGTYTVEIEGVDPSFVGGSSVGPLGQQIPLPWLPECLSTPESPGDDSAPCEVLVIAGGTVLNNKDFILNSFGAALDSFDVSARNETIATATVLAGLIPGAISGSIGGNNGPDVDFYRIDMVAGQVLTVEAFSRRFPPPGFGTTGKYLDSVIDLMDAGGTRFTSCRIGDEITAFNQPCVSDDFTPAGGARTQDSKLSFLSAAATTVYLRMTDFLGDFRPEFGYQINLAINPARAEVTSSGANFGRQFIATSAVKSVSVGNTGAADLILSATPVALTNDPILGGNLFALASGSTCVANLVLPPGASCVVNVSYQPSGTGSFSVGTLSVTSNAFSSPNFFGLQGTGVNFTLGLTGSSSKTVTAGQSTSFGLLVNPTSVPPNFGTGLPTPTTLAVSGLPGGASASFLPASIAADTSLGFFTMQVTTASRSSALARPRRLPLPPVPAPLLVLTAMALFALALPWRRTDAPRWCRTCALLAVVCVSAGLQACGGGGGGSSGGSGGTVNPNGTPAGTYQLTVTAASGPVARTSTVTLTVQ